MVGFGYGTGSAGGISPPAGDLEDQARMAEAPMDGREFRRVLGHYPTGVCAITALSASQPVGMVVGSFTSVSLEPALVAFLPDRKSKTWPKIRAAGTFCVNVLGSDQQRVCEALSCPDEKKFDAIPYRLSPCGAPIIGGVIAWVDCEVHAVHEAGDHFIAIGRVRALQVERADRPLVFHRGAYASTDSLLTETTDEASAIGVLAEPIPR